MSNKFPKGDTMKPSYQSVEFYEGRKWICRIKSGEDVYKAIQQFAKDQGIHYARVHCAIMGGFEPAKFEVWVPDIHNPENWHAESDMVVHNLSMILSMSGIIHVRKGEDGQLEPFPAIHLVLGGGWNVQTAGGHLLPGTIAKGNLEFFITELIGIEAVIPPEEMDSVAPESWYVEVKT